MQGTVKWFNDDKGYGFINPDNDNNDIFVHVRDLKQSGINSLCEGQRVSFDAKDSEKQAGKKVATNINIVE